MSTRISQMDAAGALTGTEAIELSRLSATVTITAGTISALASDNSYNDSANGFVAAGFSVGMAVRVSGFTGNAANNVASGVITALTAGKMTLGGTDGDVIVDDAAGESVTITAHETVATTTQAVADLAGASSGGGVPKNYLVNGHFRWWQDGQSFSGLSSGSTANWTADQWMHWAPGGGSAANYSVTRVAATLSGSAYGMKIQRASGNTSTNSIHAAQILHSSEAAALAGQTVTFALNIKAGANFSAASSQVLMQVVSGTAADEGAASYLADTWTGKTTLVSTLKTISTTMAQVYVTAAVPAGCRELCVGVEWAPVGTAGADDSITIELAQVNVGSTPGEFEVLPDVVSLLRCQQFYRKSYDPDVAPGTVTNNGALTWASTISGTGTCYGFVGNLGTYMRATPTRTAYSPVTGASGKAYQYDAAADVDVTMGGSFNNRQSWAPTKASGDWTAGNRIGIHVVENARLD